MKQLEPIKIVAEDEDRLELSISATIYNIIFKDIYLILEKYNTEVFENSSSRLKKAIQKGSVQYSNGRFYGKINAGISAELKRLGAKFSRGKWVLHDLPPHISSAIAVSNVRFKAMHEEILDALKPSNIDNKLNKVDFSNEYSISLSNLEHQYKTSVEAIGIKPQLSEDMINTLSEQYNNNMKLYIKKWTEENIVSLREDVTENMFNGARADNLVSTIQDKFDVSKRKAKFLASQETRLLTASFTENRFKSAGITKYRWSTSNDSRVRDRHKHLHGKVFAWGEAVIDDDGTRGNPKESYGCRCTAISVIE